MLAIGIDTHKASLAACAIDELGRAISERSFANNPKGHREFLRWASGLPSPRRIGLEGAAGFGVGLARLLIDAGEDAREVPAILTHRERRHTGQPGKCDRADALAIARVVARSMNTSRTHCLLRWTHRLYAKSPSRIVCHPP